MNLGENGKPPKIRRVTNVAFVNIHTREILLHKRVKKKYKDADFWAFFGGRNDPEEDSIDTAVREIEEELQGDTPDTGLKLKKEELIHVCRTEVEKASECIVRDVFLILTNKTQNSFITREKGEEDGIYFSFQRAKKLPFRNDISHEIGLVEEAVKKLLGPQTLRSEIQGKVYMSLKAFFERIVAIGTSF